MSDSQEDKAEGYAGPPERSIGITLAEFLGWLLIFVSPIGIITVVATPSDFPWLNFDGRAWWFTEVGRSFLKDANWLLPTFLALVLAFYAALIGQSVAKTNEDVVLKTRRRLVPAGLAVASIVVVFTASGAVASTFTPTEWPRMPSIVITALAICLLGIGVGRFESRSFDDKLKVAKQLRKTHRAVLRRLPAITGAKSVRPGVVVTVTYAAVIVIPSVPLLIALLATGSRVAVAFGFAGLWLLASAFWAMLGVTLPLVLLESAYAGDQKWRIAKKIGAGILALWIAGYTVIWLISNAVNPQSLPPFTPVTLLFMLPGLFLWLVIEASLFASPKKFPPKVFVWTLHGAVVASVRSTAEKRRAALEEEIRALEKDAEKRTVKAT